MTNLATAAGKKETSGGYMGTKRQQDMERSRLYEDNQACVAMVRNHAVTGRNRHFCVKMAWLHQQVTDKVVTLTFVASRNNLADIMTKVLPALLHRRLTAGLLGPKDVSPRGGC